jgi:arylsulfatase A-like enzyme
MTNRVVANGTPLDDRFENIARVAGRAGYRSVLFGYTDQGVDPRTVLPGDPRLSTYEGVLPGFDAVLDLTGPMTPWIDHLRRLGHDVADAAEALGAEDRWPVEHSITRFLTDAAIRYLDAHPEPVFAHLSYLRPHPPYVAAGEFATMYDPESVGDPVAVPALAPRLLGRLRSVEEFRAPDDPGAMRRLRAQYFGMISHVDTELGRLFDHLRASGRWDRTVVIVTADHGEQLGDHGLIQKAGFYEPSYHIVGFVRDPRHAATAGRVVDAPTENVDILPTICDVIGVPIPAQCDGFPLTPFLRGEEPPTWRNAAHWEWDWRAATIERMRGAPEWPWDRRLEQRSLAVRRSRTRAYVSFGDGTSACFDIATDPTWATPVTDAAVLHAEADALLAWRAQHLERTMTGMLLQDGGIGRVPPGAPIARDH